MNKRSVISVIVGTFVAFIWIMVSWMGLGWHFADFKTFKDDVAVMDVIREQAQGTGLYTLPNMDPSIHDTPEGTKKWQDMARKGPFAYMMVRTEGIPPGMGNMMAIGFFMNMLVAALLYWLLSQTRIESFGKKVLFIAVAATVGSIVPYLANWNWWHFPLTGMMIAVVDTFITWALAGAAMAWVSKRFG